MYVGGSTQSLKRNKPKLLAAPQLAQVFLPTLQHRERHPEVCSMIAYRVSETPTKSWWAVRGYILKWLGSVFLKHQQYY